MDEGAHPYVAVARRAIRHHSRTKQIPKPGRHPDDPPPSGVYVTVHNPSGKLLGNVGSVVPAEATLRDEIAHTAVLAAHAERPFHALDDREIDALDITVYLLEEPEQVFDVAELEPVTHGVVVRQEGGRVGLVLPGSPGIDSPSQQLSEALSRGHYSPSDDVEMYRFSVSIYH